MVFSFKGENLLLEIDLELVPSLHRTYRDLQLPGPFFEAATCSVLTLCTSFGNP